jgi:hypothetical protein
MAQTSTHGLLAESTSIEYVPRLSPPTPRNASHSSTSSIDSTTNYSPQGETTEGATPPSTLPTFYPSGSRDATPSSNPDKSPRNWPDIIFHGWRVVLFSCMSFRKFSLHHLTKLRFKGSTYFLYLYHYPYVLLALGS